MVSFQVLFLSTLVSCIWALELPGLPALDRRQDFKFGTPAYRELCNAYCGDIRIIATTRDYCHSWTFISELGDCLECALTYDVWKDYGDQVVAAASPCGANATPSPSSALNTVVSTGSAAASTTVIGTASSTVTPTTTQSSTATTGSPGIVSSATRTGSTISSTFATPSHSTGAASNLNDNSNWPLLFGLTMVGFL